MNFDISKYHFRSNTLLQAIKSDYMQELENIKRIEILKKGEVLYQEGSMPKAVYCVKKGKVKIEQCNEEGNLRIVYVYTVGEFFGFRPLLCNEAHPVTAVILEESEVEVYEGRAFLDIARRSPNLSFNLVEILSFEFNVWINLISSLSHKSAKERIALILLILHEKYAIENKKTIEITMSKADIASYSETSEETVVRVIGFFEEQEILKNYGRKFTIINKKLLEIIAEGF